MELRHLRYEVPDLPTATPSPGPARLIWRGLLIKRRLRCCAYLGHVLIGSKFNDATRFVGNSN